MEQLSDGRLFRSVYGGLWVDRRDADDLLSRKLHDGDINADEAASLRHFIEKGYVVFPRAVANDLVDEYLGHFDRAWGSPPPHIYAHSSGEILPLSMALYDRIAKVSDLHYYFARAGDLIFAPAVRRFLELIYDRPAVVFQTMSMRKGSEEALHIDTGPLTLTEPMSLVASWIALEDVAEGAGALQFVPGSHRLPEVLNKGVSKSHNGDMAAYYEVLQATQAMCDAEGLKTEYFRAKKGDVLIWAADLMHGGAKITNPSLTRKSLVCHYMPLGVMPTFYDVSGITPASYRNGGWHLNRIDPSLASSILWTFFSWFHKTFRA